MYVEWAVEKCPAIAYRTLRVLRNLRSKSVNSFAGHPVNNGDKFSFEAIFLLVVWTDRYALNHTHTVRQMDIGHTDRHMDRATDIIWIDRLPI